MKCVRDTGWSNFTWVDWNKRCKEHLKKYGKKDSPYSRRWKTCTHFMEKLDNITRCKESRKIYWSMKYRILRNTTIYYGPKVKWQ